MTTAPSDLEWLLRSCALGTWSWLDGRVAWDETLRALYDVAEAPSDYEAYLQCVHPEDRDAVDANIQRFVREGRYEDIEHRVVLSDGRIRWLFARGLAVFHEDGRLRGLRGIALDISDLKAREARLASDAETDPLTGLRNRRWLGHEGPREVSRCERGGEPFSLAYIDVDDFKRVNDGPGGHEAGDRFLVAVSTRLQAQLRLGDVLVRLGGDEIVALLPSTRAPEAERIALRLAESVAREPVEGLSTSVSVGVATWTAGEAFHTVLRHADHAMYRNKERKRT